MGIAIGASNGRIKNQKPVRLMGFSNVPKKEQEYLTSSLAMENFLYGQEKSYA